MAGDQIYADVFNRHVPIGLADSEEEFRDRYVTVFTSHNMRQLLRSTPNYMILDDHEIEDNWVQGRIKDVAKRRLFQVAISAYRIWTKGQEAQKDDGFKVNDNVTMHYVAKNFQQDDNFTQVDIEPERIVARTFDWKGKSLDRSEFRLG